MPSNATYKMPKPSLPKFLICDDGDDRDFVLHCHFPRLLIEFAENESEKIEGSVVMEIDPLSAFITTEMDSGREPAQSMARIMREAGDFFFAYGY